jgi:hypothetical protein
VYSVPDQPLLPASFHYPAMPATNVPLTGPRTRGTFDRRADRRSAVAQHVLSHALSVIIVFHTEFIQSRSVSYQPSICESCLSAYAISLKALSPRYVLPVSVYQILDSIIYQIIYHPVV